MKRKKVESFAQPADVERLEAKLRADIQGLNETRFAKALAMRDVFAALVDAQTQYSGLVLDAAKLEEDVRALYITCTFCPFWFSSPFALLKTLPSTPLIGTSCAPELARPGLGYFCPLVR